MSKFWVWFVKFTGLPFLLLSKPKYYYEDKTKQSRKLKGKAIVMPNHHSVWDFVTMMYTFWRRNLRCIVAELMFNKSKFMNWMLTRLGCIRVDRNEMDFSFVTKACDVLNKGGVVEIYPEARIPLAQEEKPLPFKPSVVYIALQSGAPIVPVVTDGNHFNRHRQRILIGKPINVIDWYDESKTEKENIQQITTLLRNKIIELNNELQIRTAQEKTKKNR